MEYVTVYAPLPQHYRDGYVISKSEGKPILIIIEENLPAEERRKRLHKIIRRFRLDKH